MNLIHAVILGIIEGLTEFLPISSTGHMIIAAHLLGIQETEAVKTFEIVIQLGAILAVVVAFGRKLLADRKTLINVLVAFVPTGIIGLAVHGLVKKYLLGDVRVVLLAMALGGAVIIVLERLFRGRAPRYNDGKDLSYGAAAGIGTAQALAIVPGVSRSAATVMAGLGLGMGRAAAVEFSFLLAIPTMAAATGLDLVKSVGTIGRADLAAIAVGFVAAFLTALVAIRWFLKYVSTKTFAPFGWYRIFAALAFWLILSR